MKYILFFFLLIGISACHAQQNSQTKVAADDFEKAISVDNPQILDVRTMTEFKSGHLKNSLQADWNNKSQFNERIKHIDKLKPVYIYCLSGFRSEQAADYMRKNGYKNVVELNGGISAWKRADKPIAEAVNEKQYSLKEFKSMIPADKIVLVDFGAPWCPPCVKMEPILKDLQADKDLSFQLLKIDAGVHTEIMKSLNIESIPVFIVYENGKEKWRMEGIATKEELKAQIKL